MNAQKFKKKSNFRIIWKTFWLQIFASSMVSFTGYPKLQMYESVPNYTPSCHFTTNHSILMQTFTIWLKLIKVCSKRFSGKTWTFLQIFVSVYQFCKISTTIDLKFPLWDFMKISRPPLVGGEKASSFVNGWFIVFVVVHLLLQWWMWCYKMYPNTSRVCHKNEIKYQHLKYFWHYFPFSFIVLVSLRPIWKYIGEVDMCFYENLTWNLMSASLVRVNFGNKTWVEKIFLWFWCSSDS